MDNNTRSPLTAASSPSQGKTPSKQTYIIICLAALTLANIIPNLGNQQLLNTNQYLRADDNSVAQQSNRPKLYDEEASLIAFGDGKKRIFPSWAVVTQCSLYHTDCPNHLEFDDYPFPLPPESQSQQDDESKGTVNEWIEEFIEEFDQRSDTSDNHLVGYEFPTKVDDATRQECINSTQSLSVEYQLDKILSKLVPLKDTYNMIAFSMTDETYAKDMLHEVYEMNNDIVGFEGAFFFVAMDSFTANMACEFGYPVVAMPENDDLKKQVQSTKVFMSKMLVERGQAFLFYEMDVWFVRSPLRMLQQHMHEYDFLCSTHQWNPGELNIGFYAALANQGTVNYFKDSLDIIEKNPLAHDQKIMHVVADDNTATLEKRPLEDHNNCAWCGHESVSFPAVRATNPIRVGRLDPHVVVSSVYPVPTEGTVAIHTLADAPLKGPFGKQIVAKELGVWYGWGEATSKAGYYHREGAFRRYLLLENGGTRGGQSFVQSKGYHDEGSFKQQIALLVTLAKATNRILVLPQVLGDFHAQPLWMYLDLQSIEALGIVYRETNFASNKKSWYSGTTPFASVTQMAVVESSNEVQLLTMDGGDVTAASSDRFPLSSFTTNDPLSAFVAVASAHPRVKESEALFVNLDHFKNSLSNNSAQVKKIRDKLAWCEWGVHGKSTLSATHLHPTDHCYGKGVK